MSPAISNTQLLSVQSPRRQRGRPDVNIDGDSVLSTTLVSRAELSRTLPKAHFGSLHLDDIISGRAASWGLTAVYIGAAVQ